MSNIITVIAATLDDKKLTLYKPDGSTFEIPQGDARVAKLVPIIMPEISAKRSVEVDVAVEEDRSYAKLEDQSNGVVRFFRVAKAKLKSIFKKAEEEQQSAPPEQFEYIGQAAVEEIMANAISAQAPEFAHVQENKRADGVDRNIDNDQGDTIVAVVEGGGVVQDVQHIKHVIDHAVSTESIGVQRALERLSKVAHKRRHSAKDLMKFCQKGDLHFADDGSILIYKALKRNRIDGKEVVTDIHSGKVPQKVGTHVFMSESLVDPNRSNECSNGLHVARRQYVGSFSGDVLMLCKVAPEDVIAVPEYDANKMRVCGYHILFQLNAEDRREICGNRPIKSEQGKQMLAACIKGDHVGVLQTVEITGHKGTGLIIRDLVEESEASRLEQQSVAAVSTQQPVEALDALNQNEIPKGPKLDLKEVEAQAEAAETGSRKEQAESLYQAWVDAQGSSEAEQTRTLALLLDFKKRAKVGWDKLGVPNDGKKPILPTGEAAPERNMIEFHEEIERAWYNFNNCFAGSAEELEGMRALVKLWDEDQDEVYSVLEGDLTEEDIALFRQAISDADQPDEAPTREVERWPYGSQSELGRINEATPVVEAPKPTGTVSVATVTTTTTPVVDGEPGKPVVETKVVVQTETPQTFKTKAEHIRYLINLGLTKDRARQIVAIKSSAKKGWDKLHVSELEVKQILNLAD